MSAWLHIIGIDDNGLASLSSQPKEALAQAELIVGGERHLAMLGTDDKRPTLTWTNPLLDLVDQILGQKDKQVAILATGDPMHYGIGVTFAKRLDPSEIAVYPAMSAFNLATSRLGWDRSRIETLTLHGRPLELLIPSLFPDNKILALSDSGATPKRVAELLTSLGFGQSKLTVLEHMGGEKERIIAGTAHDWPHENVQDLNTLAIECYAESDAIFFPRMAGLEDDAFDHDGQLTKKEIRAATLSALAPYPGQVLWDVGAGSGSVGIEWMRLSPLSQAIAIEHHQERLNFIEANRQKLGVPGLKIVNGKAPQALEGLQAPDRIFIGGGLTHEGVFDACWQQLKEGGILIANTVTTEGETSAFALAEKYDGELTRLSYSRAQKIGGFTSWKPSRQITQLRLVKK